MHFLETLIANRLQVERFLTEQEAQLAMVDTPFEVLTRRIRYWEDSKIIFCKSKKSELEENIYEAKIKLRKTVHEYKSRLGHVFKLYSWHRIEPLPDS